MRSKPPSNAVFCRFRKSLPQSGSTRCSTLRLLVFCDEDAPASDPLAALRPRADAKGPPALAVLIGPEGGFDDREREALLGLSCVLRLPLGPRILRADTAAVAALALVQATLGDWRG
jgi:16S rRNA (uracil1498-N3)-methyltransferase